MPSRTVLRAAAAAAAVVLAAALGAIPVAWAPDIPVDALKGEWAPPPSTFVTVDGMSVHLRDQVPALPPGGAAEVPLVLLHGTSASLHTWEGWVAELGPRRRILTLDLPGFGLTGPHPKGTYRPLDYARFVLAFLDAVGVKRCVLAGNSLGGEIAWNVAVEAPERVERLILVDSAGYTPSPVSVPLGFRLARMPVIKRVAEFILPERVVRSSIVNVYGHPERITDALVARYTALTRREGNRAALSARMEQMDAGARQDLIRTLKVPTLILWGGQDRLIPPDHGKHFAADIPGSTLVMLDDLGHVPHEEDPVRTAAEVARWLNAPTK